MIAETKYSIRELENQVKASQKVEQKMENKSKDKITGLIPEVQHLINKRSRGHREQKRGNINKIIQENLLELKNIDVRRKALPKSSISEDQAIPKAYRYET